MAVDSYWLNLLFVGQILRNVGKEKTLNDSLSSACRLLNVLEVIAPFKHFNKLREFVQMKLPPGFPVKLGMCRPTTVFLWVGELYRNDHRITCFLLPHRHPRLPHHHSHRHLSGIPLRRIWRVYFRHPCRIQRRSQPLPRPLTCKLIWRKQEMTSKLICVRTKKKRGILYLFYSYNIYYPFKKKKGNWSYWSVSVLLMDPKRINANRCYRAP